MAFSLIHGIIIRQIFSLRSEEARSYKDNQSHRESICNRDGCRSSAWFFTTMTDGGFFAPSTVRTVPEAFRVRVCPSVSECVSEFVRSTENLVSTISQKSVKRISPHFDHRCISVHRCAD